jgi:hypothetical protein
MVSKNVAPTRSARIVPSDEVPLAKSTLVATIASRPDIAGGSVCATLALVTPGHAAQLIGHQALGQQLPQDASWPCTQRQPHCNLPASRGTSCEQHVAALPHAMGNTGETSTSGNPSARGRSRCQVVTLES